MVHVAPCHHFLSQDVFMSKQEPVAFCCAQGKVLIATPQHVVNIHSLDSQGTVLHSFSTVDCVKQMVYCDVGNFIATMETKSNKQASSLTFVRVYFNWWMEAKVQPMKVRIAGSSVHRSPQSTSDQFEMVELPIAGTALCIACCKTTAILGVSLGNIISVFCYCSNLSSYVKQKQHDFNHFIDIEVKLIIKELNISEGYFACLSKNQIHVFKVTVEKEECLPTVSEAKEENIANELHEDLDEHFVEWRFESCTADGAADAEWEKAIRHNLHTDSFPVSICFPFIEKENQKNRFTSESCEIHGPVLAVHGHKIKVKLNPKAFEIWPTLSSTNINSVTVLYRQFETQDGQNELMTLQLLPLYKPDLSIKLDPLHAAAAVASENSFSEPWSPLISPSQSHLMAIGCFFSTHKEGFLYDVTGKVQLVSSYRYTAKLKFAVLDISFLHAVTDAGLETYTSHLSYCAIQNSECLDGIKNHCPDLASPVCLLGLRPFLGVTHMLLSEGYLILISSSEESELSVDVPDYNNSTLYILKKPSPQQVFSDLLDMGQMYKTSSPSSYLLVLSEAHMILRIHLFLSHGRDTELENLLQKSCLLLADHFACSASVSDKSVSVPFYHLSKLSVEAVVHRLLNFQNQLKQCSVNKALVQYLNSLLSSDWNMTAGAISKSMAEKILDVYMDSSPEYLWKIILCSGMMSYRIEKAMIMLKRRITNKRHNLSSASVAADTVAMVSLLLRKGSVEAAQTMLLSLSKLDLISVLTAIHKFLSPEKNSLEVVCSADVIKFTRQIRPDAFVEYLYHMVKEKKVEIKDVINMLQAEVSDVEPEKVPLLKEFLETLLNGNKTLFQMDSCCESLLITIYLKHLLEKPLQSSVPFTTTINLPFAFGSRRSWLKEMPPFCGRSISQSCILSDKKRKNR